MINKSARDYVIAALLIVSALLIFRKPLGNLDDSLSDAEFRIRGEVKMDSSVVILAVRDSLIDSVGGAPLRWDYYSMLINALDNLRAKAVGICLPLEGSPGGNRYRLTSLVDAVKRSDNVCLGGYFTRIGKTESAARSPGGGYDLVPAAGRFPAGTGFSFPFPSLEKFAAGWGHLNLNSSLVTRKIPMVVVSDGDNKGTAGALIPSVVLELLRLKTGVPRDSVSVEKGEITIRDGARNLSIPITDGAMRINYCGGVNDLNMCSAEDFLHRYENYLNTGKDWPALGTFRGKIVLIGLAANHLGEFGATPFSTKFPVVGIFANAIDTALRRRFLIGPSQWLSLVLAILLGSGSFVFISNPRVSMKKSVPVLASVICGYPLVAFALFKLGYILSFQPFVAVIAASVAGVVYQLNNVRVRSQNIETEKNRVEDLLRKDARQIRLLEEELERINRRLEGIATPAAQHEDDAISDFASRYDDSLPYRREGREKRDVFEGIVFSRNGKMKKVVDMVSKVATSDATILILGESGTGKEVIAGAIHTLSGRRAKEFVAVNCGAIPESLLESELFGHEQGAFTGAGKAKMGLFEAAHQGTIFLDEITETSEFFQTRLLRVLQSGELHRVGGTETIKVDVRVLAASNKRIEDLVAQEKFRKDLYYRLNVIRIVVPPLRDRKADIPALIDHFLKIEGPDEIYVAGSVMEAFLSYSWPGNVRELESTIKRAVILARAEGRNLIRLKDVPTEIAVHLKSKLDIEEQIVMSLRKKGFSRNSIKETAFDLGGIHRSTVGEYLRGVCFKTYCQSNFMMSEAVKWIADTEDQEVLERVRTKLNEYLVNFTREIDFNASLDETKQKISLKYKKLPSRYHMFLHQMVERLYIPTGNGHLE